MKKKTVLMTAVLVAGLGLMTAASAARNNDAVEAVIRSFVKAGDDRDTSALGPLLHEQFRVVFRVAGGEGVTVLDRAAYTEMLASKKIGGDARKMRVLSVNEQDGLAEARVRLDGARARFDGHITLVRTDAGWKLIQDATVFSPKPE